MLKKLEEFLNLVVEFENFFHAHVVGQEVREIVVTFLKVVVRVKLVRDPYGFAILLDVIE